MTTKPNVLREAAISTKDTCDKMLYEELRARKSAANALVSHLANVRAMSENFAKAGGIFFFFFFFFSVHFCCFDCDLN